MATMDLEILTKLDFGIVVQPGDTLIVVAKNDDAQSCQELKVALSERLLDIDVVVLGGVQQLAAVRSQVDRDLARAERQRP